MNILSLLKELFERLRRRCNEPGTTPPDSSCPGDFRKSTTAADDGNQVVFQVCRRDQVGNRKAVEANFRSRWKPCRLLFGQGEALRPNARQTPNWKKAYVRLAEGQDIDFMGGPVGSVSQKIGIAVIPVVKQETYLSCAPQNGAGDFDRSAQGRSVPSLTQPKSATNGRNNAGRITVRHRGGGHKRHYRVIDFGRRRTASQRRLSVLSTIQTGAPISPCCLCGWRETLCSEGPGGG